VEVLTSDFNGNKKSALSVAESGIDIYNLIYNLFQYKNRLQFISVLCIIYIAYIADMIQ